jgi:hypothetical protein
MNAKIALIILIGILIYSFSALLVRILRPKYLILIEFIISLAVFSASFLFNQPDGHEPKPYPDLYIVLRIFGAVGVFCSCCKLWWMSRARKLGL